MTQTREETLKWLQGLQKYLYQTLLPLAEPDAQLRKQLVEQKSMNIWNIAFTHESYDPNIGKNYEELEKLGDGVMKMLFIKYLMKRFPNIDKGQISELSHRYLSKPEQAPIALKLGLTAWIRTPLEKDIHMFEDILEVVFGALLTVGDESYTIGAGYILCYNLLVNIYNTIDIDLSLAKGHVKTQVNQTFEKLKLDLPLEIWTPEQSSYGGTMTLQLNDKTLNELLDLGINIKSNIISSVQGTTKKIASDNAYLNALKNLNNLGITSEWIDIQKGNAEFKNPELQVYYPSALSRLRKDGFVDMYYSKPKISNKGSYIQLIGIRPNETKQILITVLGQNALNAKILALQNYGSYK